MRRTIVIMLVLLANGASSEARTRYSLQVSPGAGQTYYWEKGTQYVRDVKAVTTAEIVGRIDELPGKQSTVRLYLLNRSSLPITFGPENVSIQLTGKRYAVIFSYDDLSGKSRRDVKRSRALVGIAGAMSAMGATGQRTGTFDYSGMSSNGTLVNGSGSYSSYDPGLAREQQETATRQMENNTQAIDARENNAKHLLESLIQTTTIPPGGQMGGVIAYGFPQGFNPSSSSSSVTVVVKVGDEEHRYQGTLTKFD